jgi:hypothetical protein
MKHPFRNILSYLFCVLLLLSISACGSGGDGPQMVCPAYQEYVTGTSGSSWQEGEALVINTTVYSDYFYYRHIDGDVEMPETLVIEAKMRVVSGRSEVLHRDIATIGFATEPDVRNSLWIGRDRMFLLADSAVVGDHIDSSVDPSFDTDDAPHTYKIVVDTATGVINVYYDGATDAILTGSLISYPQGTVPSPRVIFGDGTINAYGMTEWHSVTHNACVRIAVQ